MFSKASNLRSDNCQQSTSSATSAWRHENSPMEIYLKVKLIKFGKKANCLTTLGTRSEKSIHILDYNKGTTGVCGMCQSSFIYNLNHGGGYPFSYCKCYRYTYSFKCHLVGCSALCRKWSAFTIRRTQSILPVHLIESTGHKKGHTATGECTGTWHKVGPPPTCSCCHAETTLIHWHLSSMWAAGTEV